MGTRGLTMVLIALGGASACGVTPGGSADTDGITSGEGTDGGGTLDTGDGTGGESSGGSTGGGCEMWATPWIGGPCGHDNDCAYEGGFCLMEEEGFPCGTCSQPCDALCPDLAGAPVTFCVDTDDLGLPESTGTCISQCDPDLLGGSGCREGYVCVVLDRYMEPGTSRSVCVPEDQAPDTSTCQEDLDARGLIWEPAVHQPESPDGFPQLVCDIVDPVWLHSPVGDMAMVAKGSGEESPVKVSCELARRIHDMTGILATMDAVQFEHYGTYNCRVVSGTDQLSMHGLGEAIDLTGFILSDDTEYTVFDHWEDGVADPVTPAGMWLKTLTDTLFEMMVFNIILTPNYNDAHDDHFHVDLTPGASFYE